MKQFVKKVQFTVLSAMVVLLMMPAMASASSETLRMLVWEGYAPEKHQQKFIRLVKDKYDVDLKIEVTLVTGDDDFFPALRDRKVDIISPVHSLIRDKRFQFIKHRLVLPLNLDNIPNYKNIISGLQTTDYCTRKGEVYAVPISRGPYGLAYNTDTVKEVPVSWNALWDPKFKNKYTIGKETYVENINLTALAMGFDPKDISSYRKLNTPEFQKKLAQLVVNANSLWEGVDKATDLDGMSLGAVWGTSLAGLKKMGKIWKWAEPKEGTPAWCDNLLIGYSLEGRPKLKRIAEEWLNYALSDDFQMYLTREIMWPAVSTAIRDKLTDEEIRHLHFDDPTYFEKNRHLLATIRKFDREGLKRLWRKALKERK